LQFRAEVTCVPPGTLPRFEMKSKRVFVDEPSARLT
jgi:phenylacetate-coenzyme A ligase PaaK-like adenylate-forming protein